MALVLSQRAPMLLAGGLQLRKETSWKSGSRKPRLLLSKKWREAREAQAYAECKATASFLWEFRERWMHFWRHIGHRPVDVTVLTSPACSSTATCQQTRQRGVRSVSESQVVKLCVVEVRTKSRYVPVLRNDVLSYAHALSEAATRLETRTKDPSTCASSQVSNLCPQ